MKLNLQQNRINKKLLAGYSMPAAADEQIPWLLRALFIYSGRGEDDWGQERRAIIPISGGNQPAKVIIRISKEGQGSIELVELGKVKDLAAPLDKPIRQKIADFGVSIKDAPKAWKDDELIKVYEAFTKVPASDRKAIRDMDLVRVESLESSAENTDTSAHYSPYDPKTKRAQMAVADAAFANDDKTFAGDLIRGISHASVREILHEVGHAVDQELTGELKREKQVIQSDRNTQMQLYKSQIRAALEDINSKYRIAKDGSQEETELTTANTKALELDRKFTPFWNTPSLETLTELEKKITECESVPRISNFADIKSTIGLVIATTNKLKSIEENMKAVSGDAGSKRLTEFVKMVTPNSKALANLTEYAQRSWKKGNYGELYAETYSLWRTDPGFLVTNFKVLYDWFETQTYRKD